MLVGDHQALKTHLFVLYITPEEPSLPKLAPDMFVAKLTDLSVYLFTNLCFWTGQAY